MHVKILGSKMWNLLVNIDLIFDIDLSHLVSTGYCFPCLQLAAKIQIPVQQTVLIHSHLNILTFIPPVQTRMSVKPTRTLNSSRTPNCCCSHQKRKQIWPCQQKWCCEHWLQPQETGPVVVIRTPRLPYSTTRATCMLMIMMVVMMRLHS